MPSMASSIHPDFRDDVTSAEAHAVDRETERLIHQQLAADNASGRERYIQLAKEMLRIRLRAYKPESPPVAGAWCLIGSAHLKASQLQEAKEATEKSLEIYAAGNDAEKENSAALAREQLGLIFEGLGQISDAKKIRLQGASDGTMAKTRQPLSFDGKWMAMAKSKDDEVISVTYSATYRNAAGNRVHLSDIDFNTISPEIAEQGDRDGLTTTNLTRTAFKVWEQLGLDIPSWDEVQELDSNKVSHATKTDRSDRPDLKRRRNANADEIIDLQASNKKQHMNTASTHLSAETKVAAQSAFRDINTPMTEQQIADFQQMAAEEHKYGEAPTLATINDARQWTADTNTDPHEAPAFDYHRLVGSRSTEAQEGDVEQDAMIKKQELEVVESKVDAGEELGGERSGHDNGQADDEVGEEDADDELVTVNWGFGERRVPKVDAYIEEIGPEFWFHALDVLGDRLHELLEQ
ncbi:uncharacterized protein J4E78_010405 [Alternaria triticimaculans]|uniref:uncharacterized protein n=1 Tax=Alternaria triticimaculans TaxID=297637 RepID=UPI0020C33858|nr:uncharacterized protein J4E78_010405 [Alternaria triticimaculans]KAI4641433.1 hypothetical protein J4E78_010405 [Alternaria triticimaculans]